MTPDSSQHGSSLPERIGNTPLIRLDQIARLAQPAAGLPSITLLGKAEWANPCGSVKDRAAAAMLADARDRGQLTSGKTILAASGGNAGISFAMLGAALGLPVHLAMPASISPVAKRILHACGATVDWTDPARGDGAILRARELAGNDPNRFCYMDQYSSDANWLAHYRTTGVEIWQQSAGLITHFIAGVGTSGTFMGAARRLKGFNPLIQTISIHPDSPSHGIEGLKYFGMGRVPAIYNPCFAGRQLEVSTDAAREMARRLATDEGLLVGASAAAAVYASLQVAREEAAAGRSAVIVAVLPDSASRYLDGSFWEEA